MREISFLVSHVTMYLLINQGWGHILNQYIRERSFPVSHVTTQKSSLKIHIKFPCHSWEYLFTGQSHLRTDINSVNEEKKFPCESCHYSATQKNTWRDILNQYMRKRSFLVSYWTISLRDIFLDNPLLFSLRKES